MSPLNPSAEILAPNVMGLGGGAFGVGIGHESGAFMNGASALRKETPQSSWPCEDPAKCHPSADVGPAGTLIWDLQPPEL